MRTTLPVLVAVALMAGTAAAQTPSPAPAKAPAAKSGKAPVVRSAKSLDCSKQADAKGLRGKPRKGFMSGCKRA